LYARLSKYITGTDRHSVRGQTVFALTHPYNTGYAVKYLCFAPILAHKEGTHLIGYVII
jgi:hypothetical protein